LGYPLQATGCPLLDLVATCNQKPEAGSLKPQKSITIKKIYRFLAFYNIFWKNNLVNSVFF
jgi:hypothetical protein